MRSIEVETYGIGPTFYSLMEAIAHAQSYGPLARTKSDAKLLLGSQVIDGFWTDTDFVIRFSNGKFLHVYTQPEFTGGCLDWRIVGDEPALESANINRIGSPGVEFVFQNGGKHVADCSALMASRRGKDFKDLFVNERFFYVYTVRQLILTFSCVKRRDTGTNMLYVYEDD